MASQVVLHVARSVPVKMSSAIVLALACVLAACGGTASIPDAGLPSPCSVDRGGCDPNATCVETSASTNRCTCNAGYDGNGLSCTAMSACSTNNGGCDVHATCSSTDAGASTCTCAAGYTGDGTTCTPLDACTTGTSGCDPNATCTATGAGTTTCACNAGYTGDGHTCIGLGPCATSNGGCDAHASCAATGTQTHSCTCQTGYSGDGLTCVSIDPCSVGTSQCDANATCLQTGPGTSSCTCITGYAGTGITCKPIDECAMTDGGCDANATCASTGPGTNTCTCNAGYVGDGTSCGLDPCVGGGGCDANATCTPTASFTASCACNVGYYGTGINCTPVCVPDASSTAPPYLPPERYVTLTFDSGLSAGVVQPVTDPSAQHAWSGAMTKATFDASAFIDPVTCDSSDLVFHWAVVLDFENQPDGIADAGIHGYETPMLAFDVNAIYTIEPTLVLLVTSMATGTTTRLEIDARVNNAALLPSDFAACQQATMACDTCACRYPGMLPTTEAH
jgi:hypothetical protein